MGAMISPMPLLFSYGTLQQQDVQLSTFGRLLQGQRDELVGFEQSLLTIDDPQFVISSGKADHAIVKFNGNKDSRVSGMVFEISDSELASADQYEPAGYKRILAKLASGRKAWVYANSTLNDFATRYTAAWCSQRASSVASFFDQSGSLTINDGNPSVGPAAITAAAQDFMTAFPDMVVKMDGLEATGDRLIYHWTLIGTNTGPGATGNPVRISGHEIWRLGVDGLVAESKGHFDEAEYQRQLNAGAQ